ncbi:ABC transporter permease [Acutalibacter caecimuris]|uniref:ABC transporter permease n=1 Tax=Acutalibacter caecimuris TaxID=3093657 RepID=UPI002AC9687D|nr:ABC transporter permease subunit [Acutalibacter sp. M00118]
MKKKLHRFLPYLPLYLMMLPGIAYLIINNYIPMAGIVVAFKQYNVNDGMFGSPWAGLENFKFLFGTSDAFIILRNTLLYNVAFIIVNNVMGILLAIILSDVLSKRMRSLYQSSLLLPFLISIVVVSYIVFALLSQENGMMNHTILPFLGKEPIAWYSTPRYWPAILILTNLWKGVGYGTLIYVAAIAGIDNSLLEAASLDGASKWQQITRIILPFLIPATVTLLILSVGKIFFSDFGLFYQVPQNSGTLYAVTQTIDTYVYRALMSAGGIGRSAAASVFQSIVGFLLVMTTNLIVRKVSAENAIF